MAGVPGRSGGHNRLTVDQHILRGTFRPDRHTPKPAAVAAAISDADRRRTLQGLKPRPRLVVTALLETYDGWDASSLATLRAYALSVERLEAAQRTGSKDLYREIRANLALRKSLDLERERT